MLKLMILTHALAAHASFFGFECERYLISPDVTALEDVPTEDLKQFELVQKARLHLYDHPLDQVMLRLVTHELTTREITDP